MEYTLWPKRVLGNIHGQCYLTSIIIYMVFYSVRRPSCLQLSSKLFLHRTISTVVASITHGTHARNVKGKIQEQCFTLQRITVYWYLVYMSKYRNKAKHILNPVL